MRKYVMIGTEKFAINEVFQDEFDNEIWVLSNNSKVEVCERCDKPSEIIIKDINGRKICVDCLTEGEDIVECVDRYCENFLWRPKGYNSVTFQNYLCPECAEYYKKEEANKKRYPYGD